MYFYQFALLRAQNLNDFNELYCYSANHSAAFPPKNRYHSTRSLYVVPRPQKHRCVGQGKDRKCCRP
jgi:hypothetical protein